MFNSKTSISKQENTQKHYNDVIMGMIASQITTLTLNGLFRHRSKKTSKLRVTGLCAGNSPEAGEFPVQMASNAENVPISWRHRGVLLGLYLMTIRRAT